MMIAAMMNMVNRMMITK